MSSHEVTYRRPRQGRVDFTFMYVAHDAFQRDLRRLMDAVAAGRAADPAIRTGWATFKNQLHIHHTIEDTALWPPLRQKITRPADISVLNAMEAEHSRIDPLLATVDASIVAPHGAELAETVGELAHALRTHIDHEEEYALPLVETYLGSQGWEAFGDAIRRRQGLKGIAEFLPWLLDGASDETGMRVLGTLPAPARLIYQTSWRPAYNRRPRWNSTTS